MVLKALSINQPWAWCIVNGYKPVENRDWFTDERGEILIHAGKKFDYDGWLWITKAFPNIPLPDVERFDMGGIVGSAEIVDCVNQSDDPWFFGKFGFVMKNAKPCVMVPCKGALGFFRPDYNSRYVEKPPKKAKPAPENTQTKLL